MRKTGWRVGPLGVAACAAFLLGAGVGRALAPAPPPAPVRTVRSVPVPVKAAALTFDDGPSPRWTPEILRLLEEYGAKATFFVVGLELVRHPEIVRAEARAGMEIGNHGFRHLVLVGLDPTAIEAEVRPVEQEITAITGDRPTLYRLPRGRGDATALRTLADMGYTIVYWSVDTKDYQDRRSAAAIAQQVEREIRPGSIVILHDGGGDQAHTVAALRLLLPVLRREGYRLVTVSQLLELGARGAS